MERPRLSRSVHRRITVGPQFEVLAIVFAFASLFLGEVLHMRPAFVPFFACGQDGEIPE